MLEKYYQQKSILGVCLGHQTLCEFFGGTLYNLENVRHGQKRTLKVRSNSPLFLIFQLNLISAYIILGLYRKKIFLIA